MGKWFGGDGLKPVKSLIITGYGINCEEEMAAAYRIAGANSVIIHINEIFLRGFSIHDFDIINFPGGFSFGDDISSGKVLANKIMFKKFTNGKTFVEEIKTFIDAGKYVLGVCNGFQILVKAGLLPNSKGIFTQEVSLTRNNSSNFEDRWVFCRVLDNSKTPFLNDIDIIRLPVRHGEGKFIVKNDAVRKDIINAGLNCLSYCDEHGNITASYPMNPNGSELSCAGLCSHDGHVFGLMPHPEAYLTLYNNPDWGRILRHNPAMEEDGEGLQIFKNIVKHLRLS
jgi:phosphoribosylformylglycinamidine synthase